MTAANALNTQGVLATLSRLFADDTLLSNCGENTVLLVDIRGCKGNLLERFRAQRLDLKGRIILQDLPEVVKGRGNTHGVDYMAQ